MKISPSILSADFAKLGQEVKDLQTNKADLIHIDVMDGNFVPNLTLGAPIVKAIRSYTTLPFDVHLMINNPSKYIKDFKNAGSDYLTFHLEIEEFGEDINKNLDEIHSLGMKTGLAIKPATDVCEVFPYLEKCDLILIMTVEPGFGNQALIPYCLDKIAVLKEEIAKRNLSTLISVDGGVNLSTIESVKNSGPDIFVAGSAVFSSENPAQTIQTLKNY